MTNWLFLRGLSREQRHWGTFPQVFERATGGDRVFLLDLPGTGTENGRASPKTIEGIADDVRRRWESLRDANQGPWGLLGISLGGMVAMAWTAAHPNDFTRLVLASTSAGNLSPPLERFDWKIVPAALRSLFERDPVKREERILGFTTRLLEDRAPVAEEWARIQLDRPVARAVVITQLRAAARYQAPPRIDVPTLILAGARDPMANPSCARLLASELGAPFEIHPGAGHEIATDAPEWVADRVAAWLKEVAAMPASSIARVQPLGGRGPLPLAVEPAPGSDTSADALAKLVASRRGELEKKLTEVGAILLRGFDVHDAAAFEKVARAFDPHLKNEYLGTSPRNALTDYVFSASELPPHYPIPQHCEMSFVKEPPRRLFFCCLEPNTGAGGETPLADFRAVWRDLAPAVRERFAERGITNVRNYAGPQGGSRFDLWKLKRWDEMFNTRDRAEAERLAAKNGFDATWTAGGGLRLTNTQPAVRKHPLTGEPVWFNHAQVFHLSAVPDEYRRIARRQGKLRYAALARVAEAAVALKARSPIEDQAMHCTYGDGSPIPDADMDQVRDAIWKNMVFFKWRPGDVLIIDNDSVSHGRMPYVGPRTVAVAWA